jgi:hypothetical protein
LACLQTYLHHFVELPMFQSGKGKGPDYAEFEDAREVIAGLSAEYASFEQPGGELVRHGWADAAAR